MDLSTGGGSTASPNRVTVLSPLLLRRAANSWHSRPTKGTATRTALQEVEYWEEVEWTPVPRNVVNAPLKPWDVPVVDDVVFTEEELNASMEKHPAERYSKAGHLFNLHSWAPLYYSPDRLMENSTLDAQFGATLISQNLLGTTEAEPRIRLYARRPLHGLGDGSPTTAGHPKSK